MIDRTNNYPFRGSCVASLLLTASLPFLALTVRAVAQEGASSAAASGLFVLGTGAVYVAPDIAHISAGVRTRNEDSVKAARDNAARADAVIKAVRALGVAEKDLRTEGYNLSPQMRYDEGKDPVVTGYEVSNNIRITVRRLADAGVILDAAIKAGANVAGGIEFDLSDETAHRAKDDALTKAVADATRKAFVMARAAKAGRIDLMKVTEGAPAMNYPRPVMFSARAAAAPATPVSAGEQSVTANVTVRYSLDPARAANY
jgi:uncharacterized protein YggE